MSVPRLLSSLYVCPRPLTTVCLFPCHFNFCMSVLRFSLCMSAPWPPLYLLPGAMCVSLFSTFVCVSLLAHLSAETERLSRAMTEQSYHLFPHCIPRILRMDSRKGALYIEIEPPLNTVGIYGHCNVMQMSKFIVKNIYQLYSIKKSIMLTQNSISMYNNLGRIDALLSISHPYLSLSERVLWFCGLSV